MQKINFQNLPSTATPINATNLNAIQTNVENVFNGSEVAGDMVVGSIRSKNIYNNKSAAIVNYAGKIDILETGIRIYTSSSVNNQFACFKLTNELLGKTITISSTITPSSTNSGSIRIFYGTNSNPATQNANVELNTTGSVTATLLSSMPSGCDSIYVLLYANRTGTTQANDYVSYTNLQIETGSEATSYSPYQMYDCNELNNIAFKEQKYLQQDFNNYTTAGSYMINTLSLSNMPISAPGVLMVWVGHYSSYETIYVAQMYICNQGAYSRFRDTGATQWTAWKQLHN